MKKMYKKPSTEQMNVQPASIIATSIILGDKNTSDIQTTPGEKIYLD